MPKFVKIFHHKYITGNIQRTSEERQTYSETNRKLLVSRKMLTNHKNLTKKYKNLFNYDQQKLKAEKKKLKIKIHNNI